ncbi:MULTISPECIES: flavin reductase family protein [Psychrilyobacter]|uniref:Flavin reductase family protein n=1 Tax=Psychrilyobacter piezotolerans TaxID=2293438 RepID=A0ABX9KFM7_9FUSO|nr:MULTISPECIES: flavin reductase family protein [Psychrilyobacter]MCS5422288.1 flavin reductase family protein [Psychrilyobacter sp. S5]NDI78314.1 flavin reductase family protein [Psychrilyobacter piezotolerans]RDE60838.1 flavin reductase family protein [Psychrilyobacter sp. S5]REI40627.1 flavin reductase family protein [Psychrilyobacter piezotolerans]
MKKTKFKGSVILNPVPVVMVTSRSSEGKDNVFTVAWAGTVCTTPPMLSISIRPERLSYEYIKETMQFTINLPHRRLTKETDYCGVRSGRQLDKIKEMGFTMVEGTHIDVPYIDECPVSIECKVKSIVPLGTHDLFIAEVMGSHIDSKLLDENGKLCLEKGNLINYCHGEYYPMAKDAIGKFGFSVAKNKPEIKNISNVEKKSESQRGKSEKKKPSKKAKKSLKSGKKKNKK